MLSSLDFVFVCSVYVKQYYENRQKAKERELEQKQKKLDKLVTIHRKLVNSLLHGLEEHLQLQERSVLNVQVQVAN